MAKVPRRRKGYATVSVRLVVPDLDEQVQFLRAVFGAQGEVVAGRPAELRIGDSTVMVTEVGERDAATAVLYVDDADAAYQRAVEAGPTRGRAGRHARRRPSLQAADAVGNVYQIAHVL